ncbi:peptide ABC transporter substrate-binding protein [Bacillus carboniphilus]|uniref:Peptide ABC transporter substrate-binding protein n=2 Tax=Bacillus carboniphilus TaxID=86663 RepID=A0ABN0W4W1_9BACI
MKKMNSFLAILLTISVLLSGCYGGEGGEGGGEGKDAAQVLKITETAEIPTMDSVMAEDEVGFNIMNQVFEGLMRLNKENEPEPAVAEDYEANEDETEYTFTLREDAKWSNGDQVKAQDFVFAWRKAVDPQTGSQYGPYMMNGVIKNATQVSEGNLPPEELGVRAEDDKTLIVTLEKQVPYFISLMTFPTFYPQNEAFVKEKGDQYALNSDNLVYNGPFSLAKWNGTGQTWQFVKNEEYWDKDAVNLERIEVTVTKDSQSRVNYYEAGDLDISGELSSDYVTKYKEDPNFVSYLEPTIFWLKLNQEREPFQNENIRRAIAQAIDKDALANDLLKNGSIGANYAVPKDFVSHPDSGEDFREANGDMLEYNPEEAKSLWETGLSELGVSELTLDILGGDTDNAKRMDEFLKNQLEKNLPGLTITLTEVPFSVRLQRDSSLDYDIQVAGWGPDYQDPMTFSDLWVTGGGNNNMAYSNSEYDRLISEAQNELSDNPAERFEALQEAERILLEEDAAIAPLYQEGKSLLVKDYVKGLVTHPFGPSYSYKWVSIEK